MLISALRLMLGTAAALAMSCAKADTVDPAVYSIQFEGVPGAQTHLGLRHRPAPILFLAALSI